MRGRTPARRSRSSRRRRATSRGLRLALAALAALLALPAGGAAADERTDARELIERYSPVMMVRERPESPCVTDEGEQYLPTTVDSVLGNRAVELKRYPPKGPPDVLGNGPTAQDIAGLDASHHLDSPGNPLGNTCVYARDFRELRRAGKAPIAVYANIARERGRRGLAVQYWFYWYFNQFSDLHESDWEGMQIVFDADTPAEALREEPSRIILFQHAGGERADWDDPKVQKDGTHPIVYPAGGSHATFYDEAVYVENGEHGAGLGCDTTTGPHNELRPRPIAIPHPATADGPFAWNSYAGRWGQREKGYNNGPTGPATKQQWTEPISWMEAQRSTSPRMPGGSIAGPQVAQAFCGVVAVLGDLANAKAKASAPTIITLVGLCLLVLLYVGFTRWRPVSLEPLRARRAFGQLLRASRQLYGRHWRVLVPIALAAIPVVGGTQYLVGLLAHGSPEATGIGDAIEYVVRPAVSAIVAGVTIAFVAALADGGDASFAGAWRGMLRRFWRLVGASVLAAAAVVLLTLSVIGIPVVIWTVVGWAFLKQEILLRDASILEAFRGSARLVRGRWWRSVRPVLAFWLIGIVAGPVASFALIFTPLPLVWIDLLGSLVFALVLPYAAIGMTLLYFDLELRAEADPARPGALTRFLRRRDGTRAARSTADRYVDPWPNDPQRGHPTT